MFLGLEIKDWATDELKKINKRAKRDTRIADRKAARVFNSKPTVTPEKFVGEYQSDIYGKISITDTTGQLKIVFEYSPLLTATLTHWHYDTWEIH